jgi:CO dehydrogenase maturation factor
VIAVNGKGGTGKTTVAALFVSDLISRKIGSILAIDADPNSCLADALGVKGPQTIVGICEEVSKQMDKIPSGMTKDRFIEMRVQEALTEEDEFDLIVMGRPEGPGCYCYVNTLLRAIIDRISANYDFVVIDNAAGMEHISRRTMRGMNALVVVSDYSIPGVRSVKKIYELARELGIKIGRPFLVINKVSGPVKVLDNEVKASGLEVAGEVPYDEALVEWNISNRPIFSYDNKDIKKRMRDILDNIIEVKNDDKQGQHRPRG